MGDIKDVGCCSGGKLVDQIFYSQPHSRFSRSFDPLPLLNSEESHLKMKAVFALASAFLTTLAAAQVDSDGVRRCGAPEPPRELKNEDAELDARDALMPLEDRQGRVHETNVNTYVHVVTSPDREGAYSEAQIEAQVRQRRKTIPSRAYKNL